MCLIEAFNYEKETIRKRKLESVKIFARMESVCFQGWKRNFFVTLHLTLYGYTLPLQLPLPLSTYPRNSHAVIYMAKAFMGLQTCLPFAEFLCFLMRG